jgi:hypothetical protein
MAFLSKFNLKQQITISTALIGLLLFLTFFLPVFTYFGEMGVHEKTVYGFETISVLVHFYCLICIAVAIFTFNRVILRINNIVVWTFLSIRFLASLVFSNPYAVYGPIAPRTEVGYVLSFFLTLIFLIMSFLWRRKFDLVRVNQNTTVVLGCFVGILVLSPIVWFVSEIMREGL